MATSTTRLALTKPAYEDTVDIGEINTNMDIIDSSIGAVVVTSRTTVATPFAGQIVHETDTLDNYVYDGTAWKKVGGGGGGLGHVFLLMGA
jgi:hypothetical protein